MFHFKLSRSFVLRPLQQQTRNISIASRAKGTTVEQHLRSILNVPPEFKILFLLSQQTTIAPIIKANFDVKDKAPSFVNSGYYSDVLINSVNDVNVAASLDKSQQKLQVPSPDKWEYSADDSFIHYTSLEPHEGLEYLKDPKLPKTEKQSPPLIANMTHSIFTRQIDFKNYSCIYSMIPEIPGIAVLPTLVFVREDQLHTGPRKELDFRSLVPFDSFNPDIPNNFLLGRILGYLKQYISTESIEGIESRLNQTSSRIYSYLDKSSMFVNNVAPESRSRSKISFTLKNPNKQLEQALFKSYLKATETHPALLISKYGFLIDLAPHVGPAKIDAFLAFLNNFENKGGI